MKAEVINIHTPTSIPEVKITHTDISNNTKELRFIISCFGRPTFSDFPMFKELNEYWAQLTPEKQQDIFNLYESILETFNSNWDNSTLKGVLSKYVLKLLEAHEFQEVHRWILFKSTIQIPPAFEKEYVEDIDRDWTREQTYLRSDYQKLITLALILRTLIPVWGEYITRYRKELGTEFKEYYALQLISYSPLLETDAFIKLRLYIDKYLERIEPNSFMIIRGISSEDFPVWLLAAVAVKGLCVGDIRGVESKSHLVAYMFQLIKQKTLKTSANLDTTIKFKVKKNVDENDPNSKLSVLEAFKGKYTIAIGEISEIEHVVSDVKKCAFRLSSRMSDSLLERALATSEQLQDKIIIDPQMILAQWVFSPIVSPKGLAYLQKKQIINVLAATQAVLWARGHHLLSIMATSYNDTGLQDEEECLVTMDTRTKLPKEMVNALNELYPYAKSLSIKKQNRLQNELSLVDHSVKRQTAAFVNPAMLAVDNLSNKLSLCAWVATADDDFLINVFNSAINRRLPTVRDLKTHIAKLIIEIGSRTWS
jgi:hypothetical protein